MPSKARIPLLLIAVLALAGLLAGCGGSGSSDADPQQVLDDALGGSGGTVDSGVLDVSFEVESSGDQAGSLSAAIGGPFQSNGGGALPSADFDVEVSFDAAGTGGDFAGGLTLVPDGAFVGFEGDEYQLDDSTFAALQASYEQSAAQGDQTSQGTLQDLGIDPESWVTDLSNEGTEDLDGTEVVHVSGAADVPKIVADLNDVAQQTGQAEQLDTSALGGLEDTVSDATIDVYATTEDYSLRKFDVGLTLADPTGGSGEVTVKVSVGISDPGGEQSISAPTDALPLEDLINQIPGGAAALGGALGGGTGAAIPGSSAGASGAATKYYDCVAQAADADAVDACAAQLGG